MFLNDFHIYAEEVFAPTLLRCLSPTGLGTCCRPCPCLGLHFGTPVGLGPAMRCRTRVQHSLAPLHMWTAQRLQRCCFLVACRLCDQAISVPMLLCKALHSWPHIGRRL